MTTQEHPLALTSSDGQGDYTFKTDTGFALLEVLVALAASALVLTLYLQILGRTAAARQILDDRLTVAAFAQSKLDSVGTFESPVAGTTEGRFSDIFRWKLDISEDANETDLNTALRPWKMTLRVNWERAGTPQTSEFNGVYLSENGPLLHAP